MQLAIEPAFRARSMRKMCWLRPIHAPRSICFAKGGSNNGKPTQKDFLKVIPGADRPDGMSSAPKLSDAPSRAEPEQPLRVDLQSQPAATATRMLVPSDNAIQVAWRRLLKELSSLPRAITIMFAIAGLSGLGTIIPQNKGLEYYMENYPDIPGQKVLGFLSYQVLLGLQLDHIYSCWYFYLSLVFLAASLTACTFTKQLPVAKVAQRWKFMKTPKAVVKMGNAEVLPNARLPDVGKELSAKGYQVFIQQGSLYAFKGLAGRLGPIGVHAALLLILGGTSYSGFGGYKGSVMCPEGQDFVVANYMYPASRISVLPESAKSAVHVDDFSIDYRPDGSVAQFYSTLTLTDLEGNPKMTKTISVNDPFRYNGVTMYQTDWSLAAVTMRLVDNPQAASPTSTSTPEPAPSAPTPSGPASTSGLAGGGFTSPNRNEPFNLALASLEGKPGIAGRLWGGFLPLTEPGKDGSAPKGISVLARDPQSVVIYDSKGAFVGVRRPDSGKPISVEGLNLVVDGIIGSTGMEIKSDPGVPWVYAGFGGLMITTLISYLSHSQVWAVQDGKYVYVAGRSNRAVVGFEKELDEVLEAVPELPNMEDNEQTKLLA